MARKVKEVEEPKTTRREVWFVDVYYLSLPSDYENGADLRSKASIQCNDKIDARLRTTNYVREGVTIPMGLYVKVIPPHRILEVCYYEGYIDVPVTET